MHAACENLLWGVWAVISLRILFRNAAIFPETSPEGLFPGDQFPCSISCHDFSTSWTVIALVPDEEMVALDSPQPVVAGTSMNSFPIIRIPAVKYRNFMRGVQQLDSGC